jgi:hypothetical protein
MSTSSSSKSCSPRTDSSTRRAAAHKWHSGE